MTRMICLCYLKMRILHWAISSIGSLNINEFFVVIIFC
jgi:hypothetical protein